MALTRKQKIAEIVKCGKDPVYFINKYIKIQHPTKGRIPFETYDFQDDVVRDLIAHRFNIALKSRQLGLSTIAAAYAVWYAIFHKDKNILVIATKLPTAQNFVKKVKVALQGIPKWLLLPTFTENKTEVNFSNGSKIQAVPTSDDAGRSEALSLLIVDEAAFIRNFEDIWTGLYPCVSTGGRAFILSTPNGVGGMYYKLWVDGEAKQNEFNCIKLPWWVHPEHDQAWFDKESKNLPKRKVAQEFLCVGENTKIVTPFGYTHVQDLNIGDLVLTHKGRFKPVGAIKSRYVEDNENLYRITSPGNRRESFFVTGNHPALSYRFWSNNGSSFDYLVNNQNTFESSWIPFDEIVSKRKTTDEIINVLFPVCKGQLQKEPKYKKIDLSQFCNSIDVTEETCRYHRQWGSTKRYIDVDYNLGKFVGLYLAEGCNVRGGIDLGFHIDEYHTHATWVVNYLKSLGCRTTLVKSKKHNSCRLWTFNRHIGEFVRSIVKGRVAHTKILDLEKVLELGESFVRGLLVGHYFGDGNHTHDKKFSIFSTSSKLIYQLRTLNSMFDLYPRIGHDKRNKKNSKHQDMWYLEFQCQGLSYEELLNNGQQSIKGSRTRLLKSRGHFIGKHKIKNVSNLIHEDGGQLVYDLEVLDDHSFVAESAVLHNCDFLTSGDTFLQTEDLDWLKASVEDPISKEGYDGNIWVWENPLPGNDYVISADIARGDAADYSAFHVINADTSGIAVEYMGKAPPEIMGQLIEEWGLKYNKALAIPENNSFGYTTCTYLRDTAVYPRLYYDSNKGDPFKFVHPDPNKVPGFSTQHKSRVNILTKLEELVRNKQIHSKSARLVSQFQAFVWHGAKPQALKDSHDDLILSLAIGSYFVGGAYKMDSKKYHQAKMMLAATSRSTREQRDLPGDIDSVRALVNPQISGMTSQNVHKPKEPHEVRHADVSDFSWLL